MAGCSSACSISLRKARAPWKKFSSFRVKVLVLRRSSFSWTSSNHWRICARSAPCLPAAESKISSNICSRVFFSTLVGMQISIIASASIMSQVADKSTGNKNPLEINQSGRGKNSRRLIYQDIAKGTVLAGSRAWLESYVRNRSRTYRASAAGWDDTHPAAAAVPCHRRSTSKTEGYKLP